MEDKRSLLVFMACLSVMMATAREVKISALIQGEHFASCLIHILVQDFTQFQLDYHVFSNPIVLDAAVPFYNLTVEIQNLETAYYARFIKVHDSSDYLRNLKCILTLVLVDQIPGSLTAMHYVPFLQRFIFAHNSDSDVVLPGYFVIVTQNLHFSLEDAARAEIEGFAMKVFKTYFHPIFWLPLANGTSSSEPGWLYCSFCHPSRAFTHFKYTDWSQCSDSMIRSYDLATGAGTGVEWRLLVDQVHVVPKFTTLRACPFTLGHDHNCVQDEFELFVQFLFQDLNESGLKTKETATKRDVAYPTVVPKETQMDGMPVGFIAAGQRYEFRFITCHGVAETFMSFHVLVSPLSNQVWFALAVTLVAMAITFAGLRDGGKLLLMKVLRNIHWLWVMCLDQPAVSKILQGVYSKTASAMVLGSWLLLLVFIGNAYKAMVKCIYVLEPTYTTPLRYLRDLEGFELFFMYTFPGRDAYMWDEDPQIQISYCEKLRTLYPQYDHSDLLDCEAEFYGLICSNPAFHGHGTSICKAMNWLKRRLCTTSDGSERQWLRRYCKLLQGLGFVQKLRNAKKRKSDRPTAEVTRYVTVTPTTHPPCNAGPPFYNMAPTVDMADKMASTAENGLNERN